jgi:type II secretory pathway pseudopilin PulG
MKRIGQKGVTLVEMLLAVVIFMFMSAGLTAALLAGRSAWLVNENSSIVQQQARNALLMLAKDLRQASGVSIGTTAHSLSLNFTHPADGAVSYAWDDTTQQIVRTDSARYRVAGNNISAFTVTDLGYGLNLSLTAARVSTNRKTDSLTLKHRVVYR